MSSSTSSSAPSTPNPHGSRALIFIGVWKMVEVIFFLAVGLGVLRLLHHDVAEQIAEFASAMHFEHRFLNNLLDHAALIDDPMLKRISAAAIFYSVIRLAESIGLLMRKKWGEILTVGLTGLFLPWEIYELFHHANWIKAALLVINLLVLWFLVYDLRKRRVVAGREPSPIHSVAS